MLARLLFVSSLFFAALSGLSGQAVPTPADQNGGVRGITDGQFNNGVRNGPPLSWQTTGPVTIIDGIDTASGQLNFVSPPQCVTWPQGETITLSQTLDTIEMGEVITLTYWKRESSDDDPANFQPTFSFNGRPFVSYSSSRNRNAAPINGFVQQMTTLILDASAGRRGTLTLRFASTGANRQYFLDDISIRGSLIVGDPQFVGLRGQSYQVHGVDGEVYNLVSSTNTQVNSRFVFLHEGQCPMFDGIAATNCWSHPGSYLGAIGVQQIVDGKLQQLSIESGSAKQGFKSITLNGKTLSVGAKSVVGDLFSVEYLSSHSIKVKTEEFSFTFDNSDYFINQAVVARKPLSALTSHGLFGQTHESKVYSSAIKYIAGEVDDYVIADGELFGKDFVYNQFQL